MKEWNFFDKVYRSWVVLVITDDFEEFKTMMNKAGYKYTDGLKNGTGICLELDDTNNTEGNYCFIIWLCKWETALLIHELAHLVMQIFENKGVPIRGENTETFAYYQEFWYNEIVRTRRRLPGGRTSQQLKAGK